MSMILCEENNFGVADNNITEQENIRSAREEGGGGGRASLNMEHDEKRMRRQIANSNERRRMQSINAGFQSLRQLLPHHEGEKLSKAAILQQTAEYIYALEQEKTRLLSQNCQLKRLLDQQDHGLSTSDITGVGAHTVQQPQATTITATSAAGTTVLAANSNNIITVAKKRKIDTIMTVPAISDSSDEGLGSMSPEPISLLTVVPAANSSGTRQITAGSLSSMTITAKDYLDLKHQLEQDRTLLELERRQKAIFEERIRSLERQLYPTRAPYDHQEIVEHTDNVEEMAVSIIQKAGTPKIQTRTEAQPQQVQVITIDGKQQVLLCSSAEIIESAPEILPEAKVSKEIKREKSPVSEATTATAVTVQLPPKKCRIPSLLEAAIKAEPKVEVERIASPAVVSVKEQQSRTFISNTCRQNLETIVEAIKHLEGDVFSDAPAASSQQHQQQEQNAPLALTTTNKQTVTVTATTAAQKDHRQLQMDIQPFLKFRNPPVAVQTSVLQSQKVDQLIQQQCRPGVIVVKQNS